MSFTMLDIILSVIVLVFALGAWINGLIKELLGKLAPILSILVAALSFGSLAPVVQRSIKQPALSAVVAFLALFVVTFLIVKIVQSLLSTVFSGEILGSLNRVLGLLFGVMEGLAVVSAVIIVLLAQPWFKVDELVHRSLYWQLLGALLSGPAVRVKALVVTA